MPTPPKTLENMKKHLTLAEREARMAAEGSVTRKNRPQLRCPKWLDEDARQIFEETKKRLKGLELLDSADAEMLGIYSDAVAKYREASRRLSRVDGDGVLLATEDDRKDCQAWSRIVAGYAEKLGLTPTARARLAKRKAESAPPDELTQLLEEPEDWFERNTVEEPRNGR
jgi:P27 family predicted phage terminase small subunit